MIVYKKPEFNGDSYYFVIERGDKIEKKNRAYGTSELCEILKPKSKLYLEDKREAFRNFDISLEALSNHYDRPSMAACVGNHNLAGTIYTATAQEKNKMNYAELLHYARTHKDISRRCVITIADPMLWYMSNTLNTSCLNIIHYYRNTVKLFFRASDMRYELYYDIRLVKEFFIDPVFSSQPEIHVMASTAQNIVDPYLLVKQKPKFENAYDRKD
jgi:hypothetical protein